MEASDANRNGRVGVMVLGRNISSRWVKEINHWHGSKHLNRLTLETRKEQQHDTTEICIDVTSVLTSLRFVSVRGRHGNVTRRQVETKFHRGHGNCHEFVILCRNSGRYCGWLVCGRYVVGVWLVCGRYISYA